MAIAFLCMHVTAGPNEDDYKKFSCMIRYLHATHKTYQHLVWNLIIGMYKIKCGGVNGIYFAVFMDMQSLNRGGGVMSVWEVVTT